MFLLFNPGIERTIIAQTTKIIGKKLLKNTEECYAEHPYIRGTYNGFKIELVPGYKITDATQKISAVDRTPLHTSYVRTQLKPYQKKEIRLFKQFLHGINCYGAEAAIQGFSGYLCEILILHYDTFLDLIKEATKWKPPIKLSLHEEPFLDFIDPFVFIDPVDAERNVASAVSERTLTRFITACDAFLETPKDTFFFPNQVKPWTLKKINNHRIKSKKHYIGIKFSKPNLINENLIPQLRKTCRFIKNEASINDFVIDDITFTLDHSRNYIYIIIQTDTEPLSETYTHMGPPSTLAKHRKKFEDKWNNHPRLDKQPYEKNKRMYVSVKRKHRTLLSFLTDTLLTYPLSKHIQQELHHYYFIAKDEELMTTDLRIFWTQYFDGKYPWER